MSTLPASSARLPLTSAQLGVWLACQFDAGTRAYDLVQYTDIHGEVDAGAFESALRQAESECGTFDLRLGEDESGPYQTVGDGCMSRMRVIDLSGDPAPATAADQWIAQDRAKPIDLLRERLSSDVLIKLARNQYRWYSRCHHIASDGFGCALFNRRVAALYSARVSGTEPTQATRLGRVEDLLSAEAEYRACDQFKCDMAYWTERFADCPEAVSLGSHVATPAQEQLFLRESADWPDSDQRALTSAARAERTTWSVLVLAAVGAYLHQTTGATDITIGLPVAARPTGHTRDVPGMISNELPLRLTVRPEMTKSELIRAVHTALAELLVHQRYPYDELRRELGLTGQDRHLFGVSVNIMAFDDGLVFGGHRTTARNLANGPVKDLALSFTLSPGRSGQNLAIDFDANPGRYGPADLAAHLTRFLGLLRQMIASDAVSPIGRLGVVSEGERGVLLGGWNGGVCAGRRRCRCRRALLFTWRGRRGRWRSCRWMGS